MEDSLFIGVNFVLVGIIFFAFHSKNISFWLFGTFATFMYIYLALKGINECVQIEEICFSILSFQVPKMLIMALFAILGVYFGVYRRIHKKIPKKEYLKKQSV